MLNYDEQAEVIRKTFETIVNKELPAIVELRNFNRAIIITNDKLEFRLWIRMIYLEDKGFFVDFANVYFPEEHRRKGLLTEMINFLKSYEHIWKIRFTSVGTPEMLQWCNKNDFKPILEDDFEWEKGK